MVGRSSRPVSSPQRTATRVERRVVGLRVTRRWGPARIAFHLRQQRLAPSTVHKILHRYGCPPLAWTDPGTGVRLRGGRRQVRRYAHAEPGDLVHVDIKRLGRIPDGGDHKVLGRARGKRERRRGMGYWYIHNAVDDRTRLAYSELLTDERKHTAAGFWLRANDYCTSVGNARPYTSEVARVATFVDWLHTHNHHRGHTALGCKSPADLVTSRPGAQPLWTEQLAPATQQIGEGSGWTRVPARRSIPVVRNT